MSELDPNSIERAFLHHVAGILGMTVDKDIFAGILPPAKDDRSGAALRLIGQVYGNLPRRPTFHVQFYYVSENRRKVIAAMAKLGGAFPRRNFTAGSGDDSVKIIEAYCDQSSMEATPHSGRNCFLGSMMLTVIV